MNQEIHRGRFKIQSLDLLLQLLSGKWNLLICYMLSQGPLRFNGLKDKISKNINTPICPSSLSQSLKRLEDLGIVRRTIRTEEAPIAVEYSLTEKGRALLPVINALLDWTKNYAN